MSVTATCGIHGHGGKCAPHGEQPVVDYSGTNHNHNINANAVRIGSAKDQVAPSPSSSSKSKKRSATELSRMSRPGRKGKTVIVHGQKLFINRELPPNTRFCYDHVGTRHTAFAYRFDKNTGQVEYQFAVFRSTRDDNDNDGAFSVYTKPHKWAIRTTAVNRLRVKPYKLKLDTHTIAKIAQSSFNQNDTSVTTLTTVANISTGLVATQSHPKECVLTNCNTDHAAQPQTPKSTTGAVLKYIESQILRDRYNRHRALRVAVPLKSAFAPAAATAAAAAFGNRYA